MSERMAGPKRRYEPQLCRSLCEAGVMLLLYGLWGVCLFKDRGGCAAPLPQEPWRQAIFKKV